ncbi:glycerol-3-phosphate responsive antiterminator [Brevibacillus humidisoli]|uniref:glycerol-3-phosphate responsive antiterminator n=1 Tax=Brevibacillus humidisoli TaxID=2895522 RepID=UPI001E63C95F|nr:glycerol-3-phosphate responsive antiterminator [Brevibacillus humidisoli]UFJ42715.1 glycerol-3-phosphate responsive antiterminator [Brevibacillus humidisoli]
MATTRQLFYDRLHTCPLIATVKSPKTIEKALSADVGGVFLLTGNISVVKRYVDLFKAHDKFVLLHVDLIGGLSHDREGLEFIAQTVKPTGIISTKSSVIKQAKKLNMLTVQRIFCIDSDALDTGVEALRDSMPDAAELMPARIPELIARIRRNVSIPIITGGLIEQEEHLLEPLRCGALAVSTGNPELWRTDAISRWSANQERRSVHGFR